MLGDSERESGSCPFDHHSAAFAEQWPRQYAELRRGTGVVASRRHGGFYAVTHYAAIKRVLTEPETFASGRDLEIDGRVVGGATIPVTASRLGMLEMDPPVSLAYRRIVTPYFSARRMREYAPRLQTIVNWVLDRRIEHGSLDVVADLGAIVPPLVIVDLLGLPADRWPHYAHVLHEGVAQEKGSARGILDVMAEVRRLVDDWRAAGAGPVGVVSALLEAEVDGAPISDDVVAEMVFMLLTGGVDTTTAQIANMLEHLDADPDLRERLRTEPDSIPGAVDDLLRFHTPGTGAARTVVRPTELAGQTLVPGDRLFLGLGSGNRDGAVFEAPDSVDPDRANAHAHLSFGLGVHYCVGAHLAKAELVAVLRAALARLPDLRVDRPGARRRTRISLVNGWITLPARFTPGNRAVGVTDIEVLCSADRGTVGS